MAEDVNVKLHGDASGLVAEAKKAEEALKKAGTESAKAPEKAVSALRSLKNELRDLQSQAAGLSKFSSEYGRIAAQADDVRRKIKDAQNVGRGFFDTLKGQAAQVVSGFFAISTAINTVQKQYADSVKYVKDHPLDFSGGVVEGLKKIERQQLELDRSFANSAAFKILLALKGGLLDIGTDIFGGTNEAPGGGLLGGAAHQQRVLKDLEDAIAKDTASKKGVTTTPNDRQWIGYSPYVSGDNFPGRPGIDRGIPLGGLGMPSSENFVGIPPQVKRPDFSKFESKQKSVSELTDELNADAMERQDRISKGFARGAHAFVSIMSSGLIRVTDSFEGRLLKAAAAFVSQMLLAQGGGLGFIGSILGGVFAAGGTDFTTRGPTLLIVGDNPGGRERVTVEPLSGRGQTRTYGNAVAMAGGGSISTYPSGGYSQSITAVANVDVYLGDKRLVRNIDYGIRARAKELNDRRGVAA